ncbi:MAG: DUF349 domain-containing protein [Tannerella sp.]|jgi:hypothetical protein|nr:DUF349 domain-containing protein [Tannerella sp.]
MMEQETNLPHEADEIEGVAQAEDTQTSEKRQEETAETVIEPDAQEIIISAQEACTLPQETDEAQDIVATECDMQDANASEQAENTPSQETTPVLDEETPPAADEPVMQELPASPDNFCGDLQEAIEVGAIGMLDKQEIINKLIEINRDVEKVPREQVDKLKQAYYRITKAENDELKKIFVEDGGDEADFKEPEDETAQQFKDLLAEHRHKKATLHEKDEKQKEENYIHKLQLIDRLQALIESQDDFNRRYNEFKGIQQKWKEYDPIPQEHMRDLWRKYQLQNEIFYDLIKINNEFRDYDFKKNLEMKTGLCEAVEKLTDEPDAISAYHQLQKLFQQWREIGPVAREHREALWARFKEASTVINKKHQAHFEKLKAKEEENLKKKTLICEKMESLDFDALKTFRDWDKKTREVIDLQKEWKTIGFATKKNNTKIFDRFRKACDAYFDKKGAFYRTAKKELDSNLQQKRELITKAEALKTSTDWRETSKKMVELQNEWKKIGPVPRKQSDIIWKQFTSICDYFFEQKNKIVSSNKSGEMTSLETKRLLIQKVNALDEKLPEDEALMQLKLLIAEWNTVGHVPFREKDRIYKAFHEAVSRQYDRMNVAQADRRMQQFRSEIADSRDKIRLHSERDKLMRTYERVKSELQTYENNVGFFNISSKGGNTLLKEMEHKIERLKEETALIVKKIDAIDENLEA